MPLRPLIALVAFLVIFVVSVALHGVYLRVHKHHPRPVFHAVRRSPWHLAHSLIVAILLINPILFAGVALFVARYGGGAPTPHPAVVRLAAGGYDRNLEQYAPPSPNQGNTLSCSGWAVTTALWIEARERGDTPPFQGYSGFYPYEIATGGTNVIRTFGETALAAAIHGNVGRAAWPYASYPSYGAQAQAREQGASYRFLDGSLVQAERAIDEGYAPVLLINVRDGFYNAFQTPNFDNSGAFHFTHFVTMLSYAADGSVLVANWYGPGWGINGFAWMSPRSWSQVLQVGIIAPGALAWPVVRPLTPLPPVKPAATPKPIPVPSRTPVASHRPPQRSTRPTPPRHVLYTLRATHALRNAPFGGSRHLTTLRKGWQVRGTGQVVHGWRRVVELSRKHVVGWAAVDWLKP